MPNWIKPYPDAPNEILECDGFHISYNPGRHNPMDDILILFGQIRPENMDRPETALCIHDDTQRFGVKHLILYGDYREAYAAIATQGLDACVALFEKHLEHITDTSDTLERTTN